MRRWLRRLSVLGLLGGSAGWFMKNRRSGTDSDASDAAWPPLRLVEPITPAASTPPKVNGLADEDTAPHGFASVAEVGDGAADSGESLAADWVEPVDGACPISHPIKANSPSMIFHLPGGRSYARTIAERCYASGDAAVADGYRQAKV